MLLNLLQAWVTEHTVLAKGLYSCIVPLESQRGPLRGEEEGGEQMVRPGVTVWTLVKPTKLLYWYKGCGG